MPLTKAPKRRTRKEINKKPAATPKPTNTISQPIKVPLELQQRILDIFKDACTDSLNDSLASTIQDIKQCLFNRDFSKAFGNPAYLQAYTARWSPTRALTYLEILCTLPAIADLFLQIPQAGHEHLDLPELADKLSIGDERSTVSKSACQRQKVVTIGAGGGAELMALAGTLRHLHVQREVDQKVSEGLHECSVASLDCVFIDIVDWSSMLQKLHSSATMCSSIAQTTSASSEDDSTLLVSASELSISVIQQDVLEQHDLNTTLGSAALVTIMFTLNELYSTSIASTTRLILTLTTLLKTGALLLIVDSPGSYASVSLQKPIDTAEDPPAKTGTKQSPKKYPMQWLLDHTLLDTATINDSQNEPRKKWEKLSSVDSQWFRLSSQLKYPIELEDMRYQAHLYRKL